MPPNNQLNTQFFVLLLPNPDSHLTAMSSGLLAGLTYQNTSILEKNDDENYKKVLIPFIDDDARNTLKVNKQYEKLALVDFLQSILDHQNAIPIFKDVLVSTYFIEEFQESLSKAKNSETIITKSQEVYRSIVKEDKDRLKSQFSFSTHLLKKLTFPKEIKYLASKEHYHLLYWYLEAIKYSENFDIKGTLYCFYRMVRFEVDSKKVTICSTDPIVHIYISNVRCWLTHYLCSFNIVGVFDEQETIVPIKTALRAINKNIEEFEDDINYEFKDNSSKDYNLLTSTSLYGSTRIITNVFSLLRQWVNAYSRDYGNQNDNCEKFIEILDNIKLKSDLISNKIPHSINAINDELYSINAENYATFILHKIAIFLFKIGSQIEKFIQDYAFSSPQGCENTLEQVIFSIKIFISSYSYSLGLEDLNCINDNLKISDIYENYKKSFTGENFNSIEEFLSEKDAINPFILESLEDFIYSLLKTIKDDGFFANHGCRESGNDNHYFNSCLAEYEQKLRSFEKHNPHLFDKKLIQPKIEDTITNITSDFMKNNENDKFYVLLEQMNKQNERFEEQTKRSDERFEEQTKRSDERFEEVMTSVKQINQGINTFKNEINEKINSFVTESNDDFEEYYTKSYDLSKVEAPTIAECEKFAELLKIKYDPDTGLFNPESMYKLDMLTYFFTNMGLNPKKKHYYLLDKCGSVEKGLLLLSKLEDSFNNYRKG